MSTNEEALLLLPKENHPTIAKRTNHLTEVHVVTVMIPPRTVIQAAGMQLIKVLLIAVADISEKKVLIQNNKVSLNLTLLK